MRLGVGSAFEREGNEAVSRSQNSSIAGVSFIFSFWFSVVLALKEGGDSSQFRFRALSMHLICTGPSITLATSTSPT